MNHTEEILEFDKIKEQWMSYALTESARQIIREITPCLNERTLHAWQKETTEARQMIEKCGNPPIVSLAEMPHILDVAEKEGCLTAEQLEFVGTTLVAVKRLQSYLNQCKTYHFSLAYYEENLQTCDDVREMIQLQIRGGRVDDYATKKLRSIRNELAHEETRMREKADQVMRANKDCMADSFSTMRNGHICVPVKKEYRYRINGIAMDKSSTGNTVFVEPASVGKHYETIQMLQIEEENEEMQIRYTLTAMILEELPAFTQNIATVEKLDFAFSKGKLSLSYDGVEPHINTERRITLKDARHPLMDQAICVPLQFRMEIEIRGIIITGPNTGGKTVSLKTVALNSYMAQCGLHVACGEADLCMNSNYLCDIGDGQNLSENLSTFSAHLKNILSILQEVNAESLVIIDELGSGTDPTEGMGIAIAVLEELKKSGALFLVTTHYPEIKQYAQNETAVINARMDFDKENLQPLYQLIIGEAGESCAFSIAKRLGMPDEMLQTASKAAYGECAVPQTAMCNTAHDKQTLNHKKAQAYPYNSGPKIQKDRPQNTSAKQEKARKFQLGDSVMVYPDKKIGIVCQTANEKGILRVQMPNKKIWINHKRVKLHVAATELYPDDYDFSIIFDSVETRKIHHQMERKYVEEIHIVEEEHC